MKDKIAREQIVDLRERIQELERSLEVYVEKPSLSTWGLNFRRLNAQEILNRFKELYKHLNIERVTTPEKTELTTK